MEHRFPSTTKTPRVRAGSTLARVPSPLSNASSRCKATTPNPNSSNFNMTSLLSAAPEVPAIAVPPAGEPSPDHVANREGVYEHPEKVMIPGLPAGFAGEFYLARARATEWHVGYFLHIRSPKNTAKLAPRIDGNLFGAREGALMWLIDQVAANFFAPHKAAVKALMKWRGVLFPSAEAETPAQEKPAPRAKAATATSQSSDGVLPYGAFDITIPEAAISSPVVTVAGSVSSYYSTLSVADIEPNPANPRREIDEAELRELADSIKAQGFLLEPVAVRDLGDPRDPPTAARFRLIAGERRWRAHQLLGWPTIEAKVFKGVDDARAEELALVENLQRVNINPMEEAVGFARLREKHGYSQEKIAERTGKSPQGISQSIKLVSLPEDVGQLVRRSLLSPSHARVFVTKRWEGRALHVSAAAKWVVATGFPKSKLEQTPPPAELFRALEAEKLAVNVTSYREHIAPEALRDAGSDVVESTEGQLWHLAPSQWKQERAAIEREQEAKAERDAERANARVEHAKEAHVNVKVEDLSRAGLDYAPLTGADERYAEHLPAELKATGVDKEGRELLVCLKRDTLKALRVREQELLTKDRAAKLPALLDRAVGVVARLRKIGARELAFIVDCRSATLDGKAFAMHGIEPPQDGLTRAALATYDPVDLAKVVITSTLLNTKDGDLFGALRWILETSILGLAEETEAGRQALLAAAVRDIFPKVTTDPKILAEWQKAHALGMSVAELARSYKTTEADIRGALGIR